MGGSAAPLTTLRDFLELAACESSSDGFRSYPRRRIDIPACEVDRALVDAGDDLRRSPTRSLAAIFAPRSPGSLATISRLSRRLFKDGFFFWRRRRRGADEADERDSLGLPSPVVSSCSASECAESEADQLLLLVTPSSSSSEEDKSESDKTSPSSSSSSTGSSLVVDAASTTGQDEDKHKEMGGDGDGDGDPAAVGRSGLERMELSPVSVMDFPFDDDGEEEEERSDAGTCECSPASFQLQLQRSKKTTQQQRKIRRFEGLAQAVDPVDLDARFTASADDTADTRSSCSATTADHGAATTTTTTAPSRSDEHRSDDVGVEDEHRHQVALSDDKHYRLLARLLKDTAAAADPVLVATADERLLGDFFAEGVDRLRASLSAGPVVGIRRPLDDHEEEEYTTALVRAAREWVQGAGTQWGLGDVLFSGQAALADMERPRRWMCAGGGVEEERDDVGVAVEGLVMDALLAELVGDLALLRRMCTDVYVSQV